MTSKKRTHVRILKEFKNVSALKVGDVFLTFLVIFPTDDIFLPALEEVEKGEKYNKKIHLSDTQLKHLEKILEVYPEITSISQALSVSLLLSKHCMIEFMD